MGQREGKEQKIIVLFEEEWDGATISDLQNNKNNIMMDEKR